MTAEDRVEVLRRLRAEKMRVHLSSTELRELDEYLRNDWDIDLRTEVEVMGLIDERCEREVAQLYWDLNEQQAEFLHRGSSIPADLECRFYDLIAQDPLNGIRHSTKRSLILDGVAWITAFCGLLDLRGAGLDIGCHTGYQTAWMSMRTQLSMTGIDVSGAAIKYAQEKLAGANKLGFREVNYRSEEVGCVFDIVCCSDAMSGGRDDMRWLFRRTTDHLAPMGVFVLIGWFDDVCVDGLGDFAEEASFGFGLADVVGGWDGEKFPSRAVLVFVKDGEDKVPRNVADQCAEVWEKCGFIDYANDPTVPVREKTTSWFRARRTEAGEESGEC